MKKINKNATIVVAIIATMLPFMAIAHLIQTISSDFFPLDAFKKDWLVVMLEIIKMFAVTFIFGIIPIMGILQNLSNKKYMWYVGLGGIMYISYLYCSFFPLFIDEYSQELPANLGAIFGMLFAVSILAPTVFWIKVWKNKNKSVSNPY